EATASRPQWDLGICSAKQLPPRPAWREVQWARFQPTLAGPEQNRREPVYGRPEEEGGRLFNQATRTLSPSYRDGHDLPASRSGALPDRGRCSWLRSAGEHHQRPSPQPVQGCVLCDGEATHSLES